MSNSRFNEQSYYEILEVEPGATQHEIHEAYRRAKETYSSDSIALYSMFSKAEASELLNLIEEAFSTLSHQARRAAYDQKLDAQGREDYDMSEFPDFQIEESSASSKPQQPPSSAPQTHDSIPEGFAKSKFGIYEIDEDFEDKISHPELVDGAFLQKVRLYKQVNLEQVSEVTRIGKAYLAALESNDYEALPAAVFVRGFVVQVARILGLDEHQIAAAYMKHYRSVNGG